MRPNHSPRRPAQPRPPQATSSNVRIDPNRHRVLITGCSTSNAAGTNSKPCHTIARRTSRIDPPGRACLHTDTRPILDWTVSLDYRSAIGPSLPPARDPAMTFPASSAAFSCRLLLVSRRFCSGYQRADDAVQRPLASQWQAGRTHQAAVVARDARPTGSTAAFDDCPIGSRE